MQYHNPKELDATSYQWLSASTYSFKCQYDAGTQNLDADALSRHSNGAPDHDPTLQKERETSWQFMLLHVSNVDSSHTVSQDVVQAICDRNTVAVAEIDNADFLNPRLALVESLLSSFCSHPRQFSGWGNYPFVFWEWDEGKTKTRSCD